MRSLRILLRVLVAVACLVTFGSCAGEKKTGVLVVGRIIGKGYLDPTSLTAVTDAVIEVFAKVEGQSGWTQTALVTQRVTAGNLPLVYGIFPRNGDVRRLYLTQITLMHNATQLERRLAIGTFRAGRINVLELTFTAGSLCLYELCVGENGRFQMTEPCVGRSSPFDCVRTCNEDTGMCDEALSDENLRDRDYTPGEELENDDVDAGDDRDGGDAGPMGDADGGPDATMPECGPDLPSCNDGIGCTRDTCNTTTGRCMFVAVCDDSNPCTVDSCDMDSGECAFEPMCVDRDTTDCMGMACVMEGSTARCEPQPRGDGTTCSGGSCCSGTCVDTTTSAAHCGSCGRSCGAGTMCAGGMCGCQAGLANCDSNPDCETDPQTDEMHCGVDSDCGGGDVCMGSSCIDGMCRPCTVGTMDCDDGIACTDDECVSNVCENTLQAGFCLIALECVGDGELDTMGVCRACHPDMSTTAWSPAPGTPCPDSNYCTVGETCSASGTGPTACGSMPRGCNDSVACTTDTCDEPSDSCSFVLEATSCLISGTCVANGTTESGNACHVCTAASSQYGWSGNTGASCNDGLFCTTPDQCNASGSCSGSPRVCSDGVTCTDDLCNEVGDSCTYPTSSGWCRITGTCVADGTPSGPEDNPYCNVCDWNTSQTGYTPGNDGMQCDPVDDPSRTCISGVCSAGGPGCVMCEYAPGQCGCSSEDGFSCYAFGTNDPANACKQCAGSSGSPTVMNEIDGTSCSPPFPGMCEGGNCIDVPSDAGSDGGTDDSGRDCGRTTADDSGGLDLPCPPAEP